jgi:hypothetical protein
MIPFQPIFRQSLYNFETTMKLPPQHLAWCGIQNSLLARVVDWPNPRERFTNAMNSLHANVRPASSFTDTLLVYKPPILQFQWECFRLLITTRRFEAFLNSPSISTHKITSNIAPFCTREAIFSDNGRCVSRGGYVKSMLPTISWRVFLSVHNCIHNVFENILIYYNRSHL